MKLVIIEDERAAVRNLVTLLEEVKPNAEVIAELDSITGTIEWFSSHSAPDLVFMDIHLADGSAFEIFEHVTINCPIIFTTAYDEYALKAFKVNSIDYLLKPFGKNEMEHAFEKLAALHASTSTQQQEDELHSLIRMLGEQKNYKSHFLVPIKGDKLLPVSVDDISLFYIKDCQVKVVLKNNAEYPFPHTLDELTEYIDPSLFFRVNRQYLISREAVKDIDLWFNSRLSVNLRYENLDEKVLVSKTRVKEFKDWFAKKK